MWQLGSKYLTCAKFCSSALDFFDAEISTLKNFRNICVYDMMCWDLILTGFSIWNLWKVYTDLCVGIFVLLHIAGIWKFLILYITIIHVILSHISEAAKFHKLVLQCKTPWCKSWNTYYMFLILQTIFLYQISSWKQWESNFCCVVFSHDIIYNF